MDADNKPADIDYTVSRLVIMAKAYHIDRQRAVKALRDLLNEHYPDRNIDVELLYDQMRGQLDRADIRDGWQVTPDTLAQVAALEKMCGR